MRRIMHPLRQQCAKKTYKWKFTYTQANSFVQTTTSTPTSAARVRVLSRISRQEAGWVCSGPMQRSPARAHYTRVAYGARDETDANG